MQIKDVAIVQSGYAFKSEQFISNGVPIIRIGNINGLTVDIDNNICYPQDFWNNNPDYRVKKNDLLLAMSGATVGKIGKYGINEDALLNQRVCKLTPKSNIYNDFLYYYCLSPFFKKEIEENAFGCAQPNISVKQIESFKINVPSLPIQEIAINKFKSICVIIEMCKQQLEQLDLLIKSRFVEMFGDPEINKNVYPLRKLSELSKKISDGVHAKPIYTESGKPFISVTNINKGVINFDECKFVSEESYQKMIKSTHPEKGDILYTKVGATYGIPAYVDTDVDFCLYVSVCLIKPNHEKINSKFLSISMGMPYVKKQADNRIKGIGVPDLHLNQIREFDILCPSIEEQEEFVHFVEQVEKSKTQVQKSLDEAQLLFNSLMQEYFG